VMRWCEVACWRGGSFAALAGEVDAERRCLEAQAEDISVGLTGFMSQGLAAEAIRGRLGRTVEALRAEAVQVGALAAGLSGLAAAVDGVARVVGWALEMASGCGYWIDADGGVRVGEDADPGAVGQVAGLVAEALSLAAQADAAMGRVLAAGSWDVASSPVIASLTFPGDPLGSGTGSGSPVAGWGDFRALERSLPLGPDASPAEVAAWWHGLSQAERAAWIGQDPSWIGGLDGVDAASRDRANRLALPGLIAAALARVEADNAAADAYLRAAQESNPYAVPPPPSQEQIDAQNVLDDLLKVKEYADKGSAYSIMLVAPQAGRVYAAIGVGDVDRAANVVTLVPGMSTTVRASMDDFLKRAGRIRDVAASDALGVGLPETAAVVWMGYDTPPGIWDAKTTGPARAGAVDLAAFMDGLNGSREAAGMPVWLTLFGHSYGSTTSSIAATLTAPGTLDNLILTGSPGTGVMDASEWNVPAGQVYVSAAIPRVVTVDLPAGTFPDSTGGLPIEMGPSAYTYVQHDGAVNAGVHADRAAAVALMVLGGIPGAYAGSGMLADPPFGHVVTDMDGVTQLSGYTGVPSEDLEDNQFFALHGSYPSYTADGDVSGSLMDITKVVVGRYP